MKHKTEIENYKLVEIAVELANLRYDRFEEFLILLESKLKDDCLADMGRGRKKLAKALFDASNRIREAHLAIHRAWVISEPFMRDEK